MENCTFFLLPYDSKDNIPFNIRTDRVYRIDRAVYLERAEEHETIFLGEYDTEHDAGDIIYLIEQADPDTIAVKIADPENSDDMEILRGMVSLIRENKRRASRIIDDNAERVVTYRD